MRKLPSKRKKPSLSRSLRRSAARSPVARPKPARVLLQHSQLVRIRSVPGKGRGVFATTAIKKGAIIERVPVVLVPIQHLVGGLKNPTLSTYFYLWDRKHVAICLGYGSIYNHSFDPNAVYVHGAMTMTYRARRNIAAGEEITVNYNFDPRDQTPMRFDVK
jgi:SET domain-containing protein